ncbi:MAG: sodium:solute symporter family protein [Ignavibacteriales bacterium]|nr:sodium:solute symporter family protein [Ignavibacteriales bacterium]
MIHLSPIDIALIAAYFIGVVFVGFRASRRKKSGADDFILAGRTLTLPMFVATLVSTWYGGILGVGEFSYRFGLSNWIVFGVPYYVFALVFALFLAKRVRASNLTSIPEKLEAAYDRTAAIIGGGLTFVLVTPAAYVLMLGVLARLMFGVNLAVGVIITTAITVVYLFSGGFRSDVWANALEFVLMFLGFALMVGFAVHHYGGWEFLRSHVPALHLTWHGGNSWQFIAIWFFIALWTLVDPAFHQRCFAAKDPATAQRGILVSILFWFVFDFLTTASGLYARAALQHLDDPSLSYPLLAEATLPSVAKGLFYIGMLATIMSTLSSLMLISGITVGKDIMGRVRRVGSDEASVKRWTNFGMVCAALVSVCLALLLPSVVSLWYTVGTCVVPGLLIPVLASYSRRFGMSAMGAKSIMLTAPLLSTAWLLAGQLNSRGDGGVYPYGIEPMYPGLLAALVGWIIDRIAVGAKRLSANRPTEVK